MVFEWAVISRNYSNVLSKAVEKIPNTFVYVEAGRKRRVNQLVIYERNSVLVTTWNRRNKLDIRIVVLVTLNGKNGKLRMLLVS